MATSRRRRTAHQVAVLEALGAADGFVSAQGLHQRLLDDGYPVALATVYRQLRTLVQAELAESVPTPAGEQLFHRSRGDHHHHLICEDCGRAVEVEPPDEGWIAERARRDGFTVTRHFVEVFGVCSTCRPPLPGAAR